MLVLVRVRLWYRALACHVYRHFLRWIACMALPPVLCEQCKACLKQVATQVLRMAHLVAFGFTGDANVPQRLAGMVRLLFSMLRYALRIRHSSHRLLIQQIIQRKELLFT